MYKPTLTIEEVEAEFATWRSGKKFNSPAPIPENLCNQIRVLLQRFPQTEVLRRCGVTLQQARNKGLIPLLSNNNPTSQTQELTSFVKIPMMHSTAQRTVMLNLHCGDAHLSLDNPSDEQVQFVITSMLR